MTLVAFSVSVSSQKSKQNASLLCEQFYFWTFCRLLFHGYFLTNEDVNSYWRFFVFFPSFQSVQLDLEMRGERLAALSKELEEMTADGRADADLAGLRRAKNELEMKVKDQVKL